MRILIVGAVAAGTSAAAKASRNAPEAEIVIYEKGSFISYSGCGMPYYLGRHVIDIKNLVPRDPAFFKEKYNVEVKTQHEVVGIDPSRKTITVKDLAADKVFVDHYDKLVLATGARAVVPPIKGVDNPHVFSLRNIDDLNKLTAYINENQPGQAVIVGTGYIGMELCENLTDLGIKVTMVEKLPQASPWLDQDMAGYVQDHIQSRGIRIAVGRGVVAITRDHVEIEGGEKIDAGLVIMATGVVPNVEIAREAGLEIGVTGAIRVDKHMQTSDPDIYACGDCMEQYQLINGKPIYRSMGSTANKTGRITGDYITGGSLEFRGVVGTGIFKIFDLTVAQTGLRESEARAQGYDVAVAHSQVPGKAPYLGGKKMAIKTIADRADGRLLGVQIVGEDGVDKRIDVFVTAITFGAKAEDLFHLDLAYAPPYSTAKDAVMYAGMALENAIKRS